MTPLNDNQRKAIKKLEKLRVGALFMEPGTGKTRTAVELINSSKTDYVLFIVPFQTKQNLEKELKKWKLRPKYRIEGVESLSGSDRLYLELLKEIQRYKFPFVVCDESLKIKNIHAKRTKRVMKIGKYAYYKLILNGTPISKNVLDIYPQMQFLSPKILDMSYREFWNTFVESETHQSLYSNYTIVKDNVNIDYLYSKIEPYVFDAKLSMKINQNEHNVEYTCYDSHAYYQAKQEMLDNLSFMEDLDFLAMTQKMQHSYSLDLWHIEACKDVLKGLKGKTIIFVKFLDTKDYLQKKFPQCKVMTYGKGSFGLNLQEYKNIIFYDKTWDYAQLEQAKRRIYRLGQSEDVDYYFLTSDLGLDKMMRNCVKNKNSLLNFFKDASKRLEAVNEL
ncbi:SNF2-related protein [Lactobacillus crispatus]|uniref:SNF2-related protein n=1 Tax=Lactobacillus crispatus TaxID=47770 RepID=UPI001F08CA14|nr:DEAD/DEAH box helicase [Lactobacillus crispatus]DAR73311.1 MAG TPA: Chromatin remodeling complex ATPase [Caudoviricetes sp.]MCT7687453.1 DEAD/DEAH box helicase [Lactobacillus crispatus]MCT7858373.1 DEAD/DEAH box helicase [Lactobacillus crispatus]MCT7889258.1 DEAD/DEAH box helicase [Lactobacillus crispatus]MCZ3785661.1 DEAD/DEAH box helicase [Lactobacillus crispatus]